MISAHHSPKDCGDMPPPKAVTFDAMLVKPISEQRTSIQAFNPSVICG
jgi:hypothetical protein